MLLGVAQVLQGVELQHHVEAAVVEQGQALLEVELDHVDAALHAGVHVGVVDLDAVAAAALVLLQPGQQLAVAAAQVQHAAAGGHQARRSAPGPCARSRARPLHLGATRSK
jgi:hypothetical protein